MSRNEILDKLNEIFSMVMDKESHFPAEARLSEDVGLNSMGVLYLVVGIEEFFNIRFENVGIADFKTVNDIVDYIERKKNV